MCFIISSFLSLHRFPLLYIILCSCLLFPFAYNVIFMHLCNIIYIYTHICIYTYIQVHFCWLGCSMNIFSVHRHSIYVELCKLYILYKSDGCIPNLTISMWTDNSVSSKCLFYNLSTLNNTLEV